MISIAFMADAIHGQSAGTIIPLLTFRKLVEHVPELPGDLIGDTERGGIRHIPFP